MTEPTRLGLVGDPPHMAQAVRRGDVIAIAGQVAINENNELVGKGDFAAQAEQCFDNVERWFTQFGWETFEFDGGEVFHNAWVIGLFLAVGLTGAAVLMATLFNLVSDIVGGIRVTVLEEEVVERTASSARRYVVRRPPLTEGAAARWDVDDPEPLPVPRPTPVDWSVDDDDSMPSTSTSSTETSSTSTSSTSG